MVHPLLIAVFSSFLFISAPAAALGFQETEALKLFGGTYSTACGNPAAPRAIAGETLKVEYGNKRMTGENLMAAASYFGPEPPPNYQTALLSEVRGGNQLIFLVNRDKEGLYIELTGDPKVETALTAVLGKAQLKGKYRDCEAASRAWMNTPAPKMAQAAPNPGAIENWDFVHDKKFKAVYHKALGSRVKENWLKVLDGPGSAEIVTVAGAEYRQVAVCKPHDCYDNSIVVLYSPAKKTVYGKIHEHDKSTLIGKPSREVAAELERLWKARFRQSY